MREAARKVRSALSKQDLSPNLTHFLVHDGCIAASNGRMVAATPFPSAESFLVPGEEFVTLIERLDGDIKITLTDSRVSFSAGKMRGSLATLPLDLMYYQIPDKSLWLPAPTNFLVALKLVRPFISDNATRPWSLCASLQDGRILASNNIALVEAACPGLTGSGALLPCWAVDYVLSHPSDLKAVQFHPTFACFMWQDSSWMRTSLVEDGFPGRAVEMLSNITTPDFAITSEWSSAYNKIAGLSEGRITITPEKIIGEREKDNGAQFVVEYDVPSASPAGGISYWNPKFLTPVIECATHWDIAAWPNAAGFVGEGIRGVISGRL